MTTLHEEQTHSVGSGLEISPVTQEEDEDNEKFKEEVKDKAENKVKNDSKDIKLSQPTKLEFNEYESHQVLFINNSFMDKNPLLPLSNYVKT